MELFEPSTVFGRMAGGKSTLQETTLSAPTTNHWTLIKKKLSEIIDKTDYERWIAPLTCKPTSSQREILIPVRNMVFYQGLLDEYVDKMEYAKNLLGLEDLLIRFEIEVPEPEPEPASGSDNLNPEAMPWIEAEPTRKAPADARPDVPQLDAAADAAFSGRVVSRSLSTKSNLNKNYTFESFVRGPSNQFALAASLAVCDNPGTTYNPLFVYGSTGLGKTHILHAVGNRLLQKNPNTIITYVSSERFMNEMIYCLRFHKMWEFRQKYRGCDVLLVDDIQFLSGRDATQVEFFHTFNTLYEAKKQIVITSDMFPQEISDIEDRLRNRFQWGLIADIQPPDVEHRMAILYNKAERLGAKLADDVAYYIANQAKRNIRELEGALHRIVAWSVLHGRKIDLQLAMETSQNIIGEAPKHLTVEIVQKTVAEHFKVRLVDMKSKRRQRAFALPRQIAMYLARTHTKSSFPEIGEKFGGKDHTTVMHAVRKIDKERVRDLDLKAHVDLLERQLEQLH